MNLDKIYEYLENNKHKRFLIQIPEGIYKEVPKLSKYGVVDYVYGACDVKPYLLNQFDEIIHIGHNKMKNIDYNPKIKYFPLEFDLNVEDLKEALKDFDKVYLVSSVHYLNKVRILIDNKKIFAKEGKLSDFGQVLGCDVSAAGHEFPIVCVSDGNFHPIGCGLYYQNEVYKYDGRKLTKINYQDEINKRYKYISRILMGNKCCVVVCRKLGQMRVNRAKQIYNLLVNHGYKVDLIFQDEFSKEKLKYQDYDFYVFTGCPRLCFDYNDVFTPSEVEMVLNNIDKYKMEQLWMN